MTDLNLRGGALDLSVIAGRDGVFVIPTDSDLTGYTWAGQVRTDDAAATLLGAFTFDVTSSQATVTLPRAVSAQITVRAVYEIVLTAPDSGPETTLLYGTVFAQPGVVS